MILLHGTLRYYGQWVDEMGMLSIAFVGIQHKRLSVPNFYLLVLFLFYLTFAHFFLVFFTLFTLLEGYLIYLTLKTKNKWGKLAILFFICAFICWGLDQFLCYYTRPYYLHAWWHLLTSISLLYTGIFLLKE